MKRIQIFEQIDLIQLAGMDEAHEQVTDLGTVLALANQSLIQAGTVFQTQFAWASDVPTGTVLLGQSAKITSNSLDNRSLYPTMARTMPNTMPTMVGKFVSMTRS